MSQTMPYCLNRPIFRLLALACCLTVFVLSALSARTARAYQPDAYALSDNGERLAVLDGNARRLRLFDAPSGKILWEKQLEAPGLQKTGTLALSPRGLALYLETGQGVSVLSAENGAPLQEYPGLHPRQFALADSPAGTILAAYTDVTDSQASSTSLIFHNASTGNALERVDKVIRSFYLHPAGEFAAYRGQYELPVMLSLKGGRETQLDIDAVVTALSDSGKLALTNDRHFYDRLLHSRSGTQTGAARRLPKYHHAAFSPDEKFLLLDCGTEALIYDTENFEQVVAVSKTPSKAEFNARGEPTTVVPRYPSALLAGLTAEYQHQMDKEFNALHETETLTDDMEFLEKYGESTFNRNYALRREMLDNVAAGIFKAYQARKDAAPLLRLVTGDYLSAQEARKALDIVLESYAKTPDLNQLRAFMTMRQATAAQIDKAGTLLLDIVERHENMEGRRWFIEQYPATGAALRASDSLCSSLFAEASAINCLEAYNDFILLCPYSAMLPDAERQALVLDTEKSKPGFFSNRDQRARDLASRIKGLIKKSAERDNEWYLLIVSRMIRMQEELFGSRPATARLLEEQEVKRAALAAKRSSAKIEKAAKDLSAPGPKAATFLRAQAKLARAHFENGAEDQNLQKRYERDLQSWNNVLSGK